MNCVDLYNIKLVNNLSMELGVVFKYLVVLFSNIFSSIFSREGIGN